MAPQGDHPRERAEGRVPGDARALPGCSAEPRPGLAHSPCRELSLSLGGALMWARKEASSEATPAQLCFHTAASESPRPPSAAAGLPDPRTRRGKGTARLSLPETMCSPCPGDTGLPSALGRDLGGLALPVACGPDIRTHGQHKNPCRAQGPTPDTRLSRSWAAPGVCFLTGLRAPPWWTLERLGTCPALRTLPNCLLMSRES